MRSNIVMPGMLVLVAGLYYLYLELAGLFLAPIGIITMILGVLTSKPFGVDMKPRKQNTEKLIVDKGVLRTSIYMLVFLDTKLVLKRIASSKTTIVSVLILALSGLVIDGIPGGLGGAFAGYALQEFTTQRNRERIIKGDSLGSTGPGDLEFPYQKLGEVLLMKNRILITGKNLRVGISIPRGYASKISPRLESILPGKYRAEESVRVKASSK